MPRQNQRGTNNPNYKARGLSRGEIWDLYEAGATLQTVADRVGLSPSTVRNIFLDMAADGLIVYPPPRRDRKLTVQLDLFTDQLVRDAAKRAGETVSEYARKTLRAASLG